MRNISITDITNNSNIYTNSNTNNNDINNNDINNNNIYINNNDMSLQDIHNMYTEYKKNPVFFNTNNNTNTNNNNTNNNMNIYIEDKYKYSNTMDILLYMLSQKCRYVDALYIYTRCTHINIYPSRFVSNMLIAKLGINIYTYI